MITEVLNIDLRDPQYEYIAKAAAILKRGGIVAFPTETVYGLGVDFFNKDAIKRLCEVKQRPPGKPFTAHIADFEAIEKIECRVSSFAKELIERFWPGPLTLIFNTAKSGDIGLRMPNNRIARELIRQSETFIAAPSANISGLPPSKDAKEVLRQFKDKIDMVLDGGETRLGKESTVVDLTVFPYKIVRTGAIPREKIAEAEFDFWKNKISPTIKRILFVCTGNSCRSAMAEGWLKKRLKQIEREDIEVFSRGVSVSGLAGATAETLEVLSREGIDMSKHQARPLVDEDIEKADLILVMEEFQKDEILERNPSKRERVYLLAEFGLWGGRIQDLPIEIQDPIGKPIVVYNDVFNIIKNSVERLVKILI